MPLDSFRMSWDLADFALEPRGGCRYEHPTKWMKTLWIGHKGALWKIGYRLIRLLWCSPQGQESLPQVLLPRYRP